ncbi:MAG: type I secretion system permease/ATPase [Desulfuromonadales bacterium]
MNKLFFIKNYFIPAAFFSLVINLLLFSPMIYCFQLFSRAVATKSLEALWLLSLLLVIALLVVGVLEIVKARILVAANNAIDALIAPDLLKKMVEGASSPEQNPYSFALKDLHTVRTFLTGQGTIQLMEAFWLPVYMFVIYLFHPLMLMTLTIGALLMVIVTVISGYLTSPSLAEANICSNNTARFVDSAMQNAEVVNSMGMLPSLIQRWSSLNDRVMALQTRASNRAGSISGLTKFLQTVIGTSGMTVGTFISLQDKTFSTSPGLMMAGFIMFGKAVGPISYIINSWKNIVDTRSSYIRLDRFFKQVIDNRPIVMQLPPPTGQISLEHVTFGIRTSNLIILKDISFSLAAGETLGIVGPSASGKSSLARLLVGVWKPQQGSIRMDGAEIFNWPSEMLGRYVGYLPQNIELFAGTIAENIARLDEPESDQVIAAANLAGLHEIILQMPNGYDTQIGEGGEFLSGGQRQRIGLARALYGNPRFLVLDEPNANLDTAGETALINALVHVKTAGVTTILITHNPNYLSHVVKLLILQNGAVAAFGPKDWVLAQAQQAKSQQTQVSV